MARETYVFRNGKLVSKSDGAALSVASGVLSTPMVLRDTPAYRSPITGEVIEGRVARRDDLKRHNCVEVEPFKKEGWRDEKLARKFKVLK